jgi:hypothetical protein
VVRYQAAEVWQAGAAGAGRGGVGVGGVGHHAAPDMQPHVVNDFEHTQVVNQGTPVTNGAW